MDVVVVQAGKQAASTRINDTVALFWWQMKTHVSDHASLDTHIDGVMLTERPHIAKKRGDRGPRICGVAAGL